ncbi:MAG: hypothetical protein COU27_02260 [Candidatus Levybacteria bacterium CG10_big_fil_rev_8_21_14_0_10_36_7]|nr:MAG: hypothetical protein COU27_02260 [Candidatus Levybacteria bacterium CG10_big_fil_rev_8_21_14_0_10_36_7]
MKAQVYFCLSHAFCVAKGKNTELGIKNKLLYFLSGLRSKIAHIEQSEIGNRRNAKFFSPIACSHSLATAIFSKIR